MSENSSIHKFSQEGMKTDFRIVISDPDLDSTYARQAAEEAFRELVQVEKSLSRYIQSSDISQINSLAKGETCTVDPIAFECLEIALEVGVTTNGAFNIAYLSDTQKPADQLLALDRDNMRVSVLESGVQIDLGGIGKGYGLDVMLDLLSEWDIERVLLRASHSTVLAGAPPPGKSGWGVGFGPRDRKTDLKLQRQALSGSGFEVQGPHIEDPHNNKPAQHFKAWALAPSGAAADALSTAFMIMDADAIRTYLQTHPEICAWLQTEPNGEVRPKAPIKISGT